jgi:hypothetical protein
MDSMQIDVSADYRLDCFVNRVSYDRMLESLQLLLQSSVSSSSESTSSSSSSVSELKISQAIKDLLLYSYPNSMLRLARSPGGLKLALPALHVNHLRISNNIDDDDDGGDGDLDRVGVSAINEVGGEIGDGSASGENRLINSMRNSDVGVQHEVTSTTTTAVTTGAVVDEDDYILAIDRISIVEPSPATAPSSINNPTSEAPSPGVMTTVASALSSLLQQSNNINIIDNIPIIPPQSIKIKTILLAERNSNNNKTPLADLFYQPIFKTNVRLRAVAQLPDIITSQPIQRISRTNSLDVTESAPGNGDTTNYPSGAVLDNLYQKSSRIRDINSNVTTTAEYDNTSRDFAPQQSSTFTNKSKVAKKSVSINSSSSNNNNNNNNRVHDGDEIMEAMRMLDVIGG